MSCWTTRLLALRPCLARWATSWSASSMSASSSGLTSRTVTDAEAAARMDHTGLVVMAAEAHRMIDDRARSVLLINEALEELDEPEEAHPTRAIAAAAASRKPLLFLVMIRFLFMIRSFGRWCKDFYAGGHVPHHGLVVTDEQVGDRQVALQVS